MRSQRHLVDHGYCSRDTTVAQGGWSPCTVVPVALSLTPDNAMVGDADIDVRISGRNFSDESQVVVGVVRRSTYVSPSEIIITVQPSKVATPGVIQFVVQTGWYFSQPLDFTFTPPPGG